ncbi:hypothetical protein [Bradyrhizobium sp. Ash2021]|nr:hypothetical protein [Bradyrhizobium sp. Ash2021]
MKLVSASDEGGREQFRCADCDDLDPMLSPEAQGWLNSPLRPPAK